MSAKKKVNQPDSTGRNTVRHYELTAVEQRLKRALRDLAKRVRKLEGK